ncbi:pyridoxamine 5'-phosphate oxidase family protein [Actinomycetospora termitidis]|uniref:Pyridoxamine 5'-phosphate oxidase family protein n=1 Tax=Actinomycetospora termitidis TaxID=3053470 RepID=A0ABT7MFP2_9PSEU|nr:pyridoxamine 5'-phosphate oxidase family protein [Actinomycetospora sp. Odt1-22]MDL5159489.1 pyridoxamine 5'-phosphate oxidase family protein [Actinomycetospora sp. Odt1-22]
MLLDPSDPVLAHAHERLAAEPVIWLATTRPHAVPVWFGWSDPTVTIFSRPDTAKIGHLRRDPAVALHLDTAGGGGDVVLLEGRVEFDDRPAGEEAFASKYAGMLGGQSFADWRSVFSTALTVVVAKVVTWRLGEGGLEHRSVP